MENTKGKTITISPELEASIVEFCDDELNCHINDGYANSYESEIRAQIELLRLLGYEAMATGYEADFENWMKEWGDDE